MNRVDIKVPNGIRYLGDWKEFNLRRMFPPKCIINKQLPGCGFTEFAITNEDDVIIALPRLMLMWNKFDQHKEDVYIVINSLDRDPESDKDISKDDKAAALAGTPKKLKTEEELKKEEEEKEKELKSRSEEIYKRLFSEIQEYCRVRMEKRLPMKFLVTYDSYHLLREILIKLGIFLRFLSVIDEFQSILHDSRFKAGTESGFLRALKDSPNAYFVSATPMLEEYLDMLDEFKDLPYYDLDWESEQPGRIIRPTLDVLTMKSVGTKALEIIDTYKKGDFEKATIVKGKDEFKEVISDEAVFYMNSVKHIISVIKKAKLTPEETLILCSKTDDNERRIKKKLGKKWDIGKVPLRDVKPKMFTFCTRTVYLGADFYSKCARTFIFSDSNLDCLAVDISEDLPQILGRQRLDENPWKNQATFYYRSTADYRNYKKEDFDERIEKKMNTSKNLLKGFDVIKDSNNGEYDEIADTVANNYLTVALLKNYQNDYVGVDKVKNPETGKIELVPSINQLVLVSEIRAFNIQQVDYRDRFTVFSKVNKVTQNQKESAIEAEGFLREYNSLTTIADKMKLLCNADLSKEGIELVLDQIPDADEIKAAYLTLGPSRIKSLGCTNISKIRKAMGIKTFNKEELAKAIYTGFQTGDSISLSQAKEGLKYLYDQVGYKATAKGTDLKQYFNIREFFKSTKDENGVRKNVKCVEILEPLADSELFKIYTKLMSDDSSREDNSEQCE